MQNQERTTNQRYNGRISRIPAAGYLIAGTGIGAALALLFAPRPGRELRHDIAVKTHEGIDTARKTAVEIQQRTGEIVNSVKKNALALTDIWRTPALAPDVVSSPDGSIQDGIDRLQNESPNFRTRQSTRKQSNIV